MKKVFLLMAVATLLFSCSKKDGNAASGENGFYMKGTFDGKEMDCGNYLAGHLNHINNGNGTTSVQLILDGRWYNTPSPSPSDIGGYELVINNFPEKTGTYLMAPSGQYVYESHGLLWISMDEASENTNIYGTVGDGIRGKTFIESFIDNIVAGTFEFKGKNNNSGTKSVTKGSFRMKYDINNI
ncbi:hypothetical protein [Niabella ginsenosidivorans]|nr:hypothetical protein [Niabella ginsenosidivorans]